MTLKEAIESGRPFRRRAWVPGIYWCKQESDNYPLMFFTTDEWKFGSGGAGPIEPMSCGLPSIEDLCAEDWELQESETEEPLPPVKVCDQKDGFVLWAIPPGYKILREAEIVRTIVSAWGAGAKGEDINDAETRLLRSLGFEEK